MFVLTCFLWLAAATLTCWLLMHQAAEPETVPAPPPPDPVIAEVDRWMHQWDRGRA